MLIGEGGGTPAPPWGRGGGGADRVDGDINWGGDASRYCKKPNILYKAAGKAN